MRPRLKCALMVILAVSTYAVIREATGELSVVVVPDPRPINPVRKRRIALHEAGHAVVYAALRGAGNLRHLYIRDVYGTDGTLGEMGPNDEDLNMMASYEALQRASYLLAGQSASVVIGDGPNNGASDDIKRASEMIWRMHGQYGMGRTFSYYEGPLEAPPQIETLVEVDLQEANACAAIIIGANRATVIALADALLAAPVVNGKRALYTAALVDFFRAHPVVIPDHADLPWFCATEPFGSK